ncbi:unnamed protein product [Brachionus calyciflorus]|uniref:Uncharacterized protein n=1 Tax=Brachionus calyciflorus TaxID=104777 RepID=A0A813YMC3_9BILA|nr:unnamed protein product [Brachionus calyciflorus]
MINSKDIDQMILGRLRMKDQMILGRIMSIDQPTTKLDKLTSVFKSETNEEADNNLPNYTSQTFNIDPKLAFEKTKIERLLNNLKMELSCGLDRIMASVLKRFAKEFSFPLSKIFIRSLGGRRIAGFLEANKKDPLDNYVKLHESIRRNGSQRIVSCQKIRPGYANKMYNVLSALTIAILTDSSISIQWPEIEQFINSPLLNIFNQTKLNNPKSIAAYNSNTWNYKKGLNVLLDETKTNIPNQSHLIFKSNTAFFFDLTSNPKYYTKLLDYKLVKQETIQKALTKYNLYKEQNRTLEQEDVEDFLSIGFQVGHRLINKFWLLNSTFEKYVNDYYVRHFQSNYVIGIQIRYQFLKKNETNLDTFFQCAEQIENGRFDKNSSVKWFVTSDANYVFKKFKQVYGEKIIEGVGKLGHVLYNQQAYFRTILDNELLARSNEIIITGGSTYGFMASIRKGQLPYYIDGIHGNIPCRKMIFSSLPRANSRTALF